MWPEFSSVNSLHLVKNLLQFRWYRIFPRGLLFLARPVYGLFTTIFPFLLGWWSCWDGPIFGMEVDVHASFRKFDAMRPFDNNDDNAASMCIILQTSTNDVTKVCAFIYATDRVCIALQPRRGLSRGLITRKSYDYLTMW